MKKLFMVAVAVALSMGCSTAFAAEFPDVPSGHWAYNEVKKASDIGFISGMDNGTFGLGENVTRAQFVSMLGRMFEWEKIGGTSGSFADNANQSMWYFKDIETAVQKGVVKTDETNFRPNDAITREEMAVMLVRALGYDSLAEEAAKMSSIFSDVTTNKGYINLAYDFGIVSGTGEGQFAPKGNATREATASMLIRCYDKRNSDTDFLHGFYAFSSYNQKDMATKMDAVSFGWGKMEYGADGVVVNTTATNNNEWMVPSGYEAIVKELEQAGVKKNLNVFMDDAQTVSGILNSEANRQGAVDAIMEEMTMEYKQLGSNPYDGVTIDFEGLRGTELKANFVAFLKELDGELNKAGKTLYVAVQPPLKSGAYYDGYDFKAIGEVADKVILMAYHYQPATISQDVMNSGFTTTPVTPFDEVYYALRTVLNKDTGMQDKSKLVLGVSPSENVEWDVANGVITNNKGISNAYSDITALLGSGAKDIYNEKYRSPYLTVSTADGQRVIWYEDARSIEDKMELARMFGVNGVSVWRLGVIPNGSGNSDIWGALQK